jgi:hypothetical protein
MVRRYLPQREDGLVRWVVPGKRRRGLTTRLDVTRGSEGLPREKARPGGRALARHATVESGDGPAGRMGGGKGDGQADEAKS